MAKMRASDLAMRVAGRVQMSEDMATARLPKRLMRGAKIRVMGAPGA
jgi:hypothetical protein